MELNDKNGLRTSWIAFQKEEFELVVLLADRDFLLLFCGRLIPTYSSRRLLSDIVYYMRRMGTYFLKLFSHIN